MTTAPQSAPSDLKASRTTGTLPAFRESLDRVLCLNGLSPIERDNNVRMEAVQRDYAAGWVVEELVAALRRGDVAGARRPALAVDRPVPPLEEFLQSLGGGRVSPERFYAALGGWIECGVQDFPGGYPLVEVKVGARVFCRQLTTFGQTGFAEADREASCARSFCGAYSGASGEMVHAEGRILQTANDPWRSALFPFEFEAGKPSPDAQIVFPEGITRRFTVAEQRVPELREAVRRMARAAKKLELTPEPSLTVDPASRRERRVTKETQIKDGAETLRTDVRHHVVPVVDCTINLPGAALRAPGAWRVLAVIQPVIREGQTGHENEIFAYGNSLSKVEHYRNHGPNCDHCHKTRPRSRTLVVEETGSGRLMQLGVDCAALYVGDRVQQEVGGIEFQSFICEVLRPYDHPEDSEEMLGGGQALCAWDSEEVVAHTVACVRAFGWKPTKQQEYPYRPNADATAQYVMARISERWYSLLGREAAAPYEVTDGDREQAATILHWLGEQAPDPEKDEYLANLQEMYAPGWISEKRLSFAVSIVRAHKRALEQREREAAAKVSRHVGTLGEQSELSLTLRGITEFDGFRGGTSKAIRFTDAEGNMFSWLTGSAPAEFKESRVGETFKITGTVAKHEEFRGALVTRLTRVKVMTEQVANAAGAPRRRKTKPKVVDHAAEACAEEGIAP